MSLQDIQTILDQRKTAAIVVNDESQEQPWTIAYMNPAGLGHLDRIKRYASFGDALEAAKQWPVCKTYTVRVDIGINAYSEKEAVVKLVAGLSAFNTCGNATFIETPKE